jgi:hypothetical protein
LRREARGLIAEACPIFRVMATGIRRKINVTWRLRPVAAIDRDQPLENPDGVRSLALA